MTDNPIRWYEFHRWLNPFRTKYLVLWTPFTPEEIERELRPFMFQQARRSDPGPIFTGRVESEGFALRLWRKPVPEIHVHSWLMTRYELRREGTHLHISYGATRWSARMAAAIIFTLVVCVIVLGIGAIHTGNPFSGLIAFSSALSVVAFGIGRWRHRQDLDFYTRFLTFILMAHVVHPAPD